MPAGPRKGNTNAFTHGLTRFSLGGLPKGLSHVTRQVGLLRRTLEDAVLASRKIVSLTDASLIDAAVKWERHGQLARAWLNKKAADLSPDQLLSFSRDVARAASERHRCIMALGLDVDDSAPPWAKPNALEAVGSEATDKSDQREAANDPNAAPASVDAQEPCASC